MKQKTQKIILITLMVSMLVPSVFFYKPQKAEAFTILGTGVDMVEIKEYILDPIAYAFINVMVSQMSKEAIRWINGPNYQGATEGGKVPGFITQPGVFLQNTADAALGEYVKGVVPFLCSPFKVDVQLALKTKYGNSINTNYCTLTKIGENAENAYENFINDFNEGGWERWVRLTTNPGNNRYGSVVIADAEAKLTIGDAKLSIGSELSRGFLDQKVTTGECPDFAKVSMYDKNGDPFPDTGFLVKGHWVNPYTDEDLGPVLGLVAPCIGTDTRKTEIITPGAFLQTGISEAIGDSKSRLRIADEIDELIGTLLSKLVMTGFDALGLSGANNFEGEEGNISNVKAQIRNLIDSITSKTQEYINVKKASLHLIGNFELDGVTLGTPGQVNQKINWAGNDFEWVTGRYYKEDRSAKIDWTGEPFGWSNNIHYGNRNTTTGVIPIIGCATPEDTKLPISYVTTESFTSPFWGKSECLKITDTNGNLVDYKWGTTTPIAKENSVVRAVSDSCGQNNIGATGYVVIAESDGVWSSSVCKKIGTSSFDWSDTIKTSKKIYSQKTTRYIERMVDWNNLLFNWEEGRVYDSRDFYMPGFEMMQSDGHESHIEDKYKWNVLPLSIDDLSSPPKLCFPGTPERSKMIYGVKKDQNSGYERWTILQCTQSSLDPASAVLLRDFQNREGAQEGYGAWKKLGDAPPATIRIALEGDIFNNLTENYGSAEVKKMFDDLLACFATKHGATSPEVSNINSQIAERKTQRLQIISDILLAEKMIEDVKFLENSFDGLGANGLFDYTYFMEQLGEITKVIGISDAQLAEANNEKKEIEAKNTLVGLQLRMCLAGDDYVGTEADYTFAHDTYYPKGYTDGTNAYGSGELNSLISSFPRGELDPSGNPIKKGFTNGEKEGYRDGYIAGFEQAETDYIRNQEPR